MFKIFLVIFCISFHSGSFIIKNTNKEILLQFLFKYVFQTFGSFVSKFGLVSVYIKELAFIKHVVPVLQYKFLHRRFSLIFIDYVAVHIY